MDHHPSLGVGGEEKDWDWTGCHGPGVPSVFATPRDSMTLKAEQGLGPAVVMGQGKGLRDD